MQRLVEEVSQRVADRREQLRRRRGQPDAHGLDVEDGAADGTVDRQRELGDDARDGADEARIDADVGQESRRVGGDHPSDHPLVQREAIPHLRVPVLRRAPEPVVLQDVDARQHPLAGDLTQPGESPVELLPLTSDVCEEGHCLACCLGQGALGDELRRGARLDVPHRRTTSVGVRRVHGPFEQPGQLAAELRVNLVERIDHHRVELRPTRRDHHLQRDIGREGGAIDAVGRERVVHVCNCHDPALHRDRIGRKAARVSRPVPALVVRQGDGRGEIEQVGAGADEELVSEHGMPLDRLALRLRERARLQQDAIRNRHLADVVQRARDPQALAPGVVETEPLGDALAGETDALHVTGRAVPKLRGGGESAQHLFL